MPLLDRIVDREWRRIVGRSFLGVFGCVAVSLLIYYLLETVGSEASRLSHAILVPIIISAPLFVLLSLKMREFSRLRQMYAQRIARDGLTECFNGPTFSAFVDALVGTPEAESKETGGALLLIDADHLRSVNERFGHGWGDQALRIIAETIRAAVRSGDLVGRLGGQEFGVFLPGANRENAEDVAERIRAAVAEVYFAPAASKWTLTVSVGAVLFENELVFEELYRAADQQLRKAKASGRNRVEYRRLGFCSSGSPAQPSSLH